MSVPLPLVRLWKSSASPQVIIYVSISAMTQRTSYKPYSLRQTADGYFVLHSSAAIQGSIFYRVIECKGDVTSQVFAPRYASNSLRRDAYSCTSAAMPRLPRIRRMQREQTSRTDYVYRCTVCGRTFNKKRMDGALNPHKNRRGSAFTAVWRM